MASLTAYKRIEDLLSKNMYSTQGIADKLGMSRVTVTKILKSNPNIIEHQTWPRTYGIKGIIYTTDKSAEVEQVLGNEEVKAAQAYLDQLLSPGMSLDLAVQFQAVESAAGADVLIKALKDCVKVAEYYKTFFTE